ncbi:MAG: RDD family protein [Myxococcota bacterium]|nr:RDD family protein [Myxococcota bacterium]
MDAAPTARMDTLRSVETPEGVQLELHVAGPFARGLALLLDVMIRMALMIGVSIPMAFLGEAGAGLLLILFFVLEWFYPVFFEIFFEGATPGKKALGLRVVRDDGTPVDWTASILRNLLRAADLMPFGYQAGLLAMVLNKDFKRLGDLAAGTVVVYADRVMPPAQLPAAEPRRVDVGLDPREQRAIVDFAERSEAWGPERSEELATILEPLVGKQRRIDRLLGMARYLVGER